MERKFSTVEELFKSGRLRLDDYVEYTPVAGSYITKSEDTGSKSARVETDKDAKWILHNFDDEMERFDIVTKDTVNNVTLRGPVGFKYGFYALHAICRECYSIPEKGILARSMTFEDFNEKVGCIRRTNNYPRRYAYYPHGSKVSGKIEYKGNMYEKVAHCGEFARFYMYDGGGKEEVDKHGIAYRKPLSNNPVFVTGTYCDISRENISREHLLASAGVYVNPSCAYFCMFSAFSAGSEYASHVIGLYCSDGYEGEDSYGVCPLVSFSTQLLVDITDEHRDGSSPEKAWKIVWA